MVVGAGRGPLIRASLRAATRANRKIVVYAVEKNPNAVITLQHFVARENLQDVVQIYPGDMRTCALDIEVDVLVSELLGSFGDNELSPECLDGAQRFIRPGGSRGRPLLRRLGASQVLLPPLLAVHTPAQVDLKR